MFDERPDQGPVQIGPAPLSKTEQAVITAVCVLAVVTAVVTVVFALLSGG